MTASNEWRDRPSDQRFQTIEALRAKVAARRLRSRAVDVDMGRIHFQDRDGRLVINSAVSECEPSHWSFSQLAGQLNAPASYLRTLPLDLLTSNLNHGVKASELTTSKFMTVAPEGDEGGSILQAVTSPKYGRIWDADAIDAVVRMNERTGGRFYNPKAYEPDGTVKPSGLYASDHDVFMFMIDGGSLLDVGERAKFNRGFFCWNSETGARSFGLTTFLFNVVCGNHIVWGARDINTLVIRHTSGGPYRFDSEAAPLLMKYAQSSAVDETATIRKAIEAKLPDKDALPGFASRFKITRPELKEAEAFAKREEGKFETVWDLVQGLTAYSRGFEFIDARTDLERRAGSILKSLEA